MNIKQFLHQYFYPIYIRLWVERFFKVKKGQIVIDAGAYLGGFTIYAAGKVGRTGKVISFEPDPKNFVILKKRIENSNLKNVVLINKALGGSVKEVDLESADHFSSVVIKTSKRSTFRVQQTTLDQEMKNLGINKAHFIKMNIEGSEVDAIKGAAQLLSNTDHVAISCHVVSGKSTAGAIEPLLRQSGFKTKVLKRRKIIIDFGHIDIYGFR